MYKIFSLLLFSVLLMSLLLSSTVEAAAPVRHDANDPNLVGLWHFDEGSGTVAQDSKGGDNNGILSTSANTYNWGVTGKFGTAITVNTLTSTIMDARVTVPLTGMKKEAGTIAFWAKIALNQGSSKSNYRYFVGWQGLMNPSFQPGRVQIYLYPATNSISLGLGGESQLDTRIREMNLNEWYHIALTWQQTDAATGNGIYQLYLNGIDISYGTMKSGYTAGTYKNMAVMSDYGDIGNDRKVSPGPENAGIAGTIDEVGFYNAAISREKIQQLAGYVVPPVPGVKYDLVKDYNIDWLDFEIMAQHWLNNCSTTDCNGADLDNNNIVDLQDFNLFAHRWLIDPNFVHSWGFAEQQLINTITKIGNDPNKYPSSTSSTGTWLTNGPSNSWTSGWFPGCLWYMYQDTGDESWRQRAERWTAMLESQKNSTNNTDIGFLIFCSFGNGYRLTGNQHYKDVILTAAQSLSTRYNSTVGCIKSWNNYKHYNGTTYYFPVITDHMMILEIMFWAAKNGGDPNYYNMAVSHAYKTMQNNIRPDGGSWQVVAYDPNNGNVLAKMNKQGAADWSTWTRGHAWGVHGFTIAYRETGDPNFLATAKKCADYFIDHLPTDYVPYWDFNAPDFPPSDPNSHLDRDTSAASIAASGLLKLSTLVSTQQDKEKYYNAACNILNSLSSPAYLAEGTNSSAILLHGVQDHRHNLGVDVSLIHADHYFIEALLQYQDLFH